MYGLEHFLAEDYSIAHLFSIEYATLPLRDQKKHQKMSMKSAEPGPKKQFYRNYRRPIPKPTTRQCDIYITSTSNYKAQQKHCQDLLNSGIRDIYLHCMGSAITRGINLALTLINNSNNTLSYAINTSTVEIIEESHPLYADDDSLIQERNNSAIHIKISRISNIFDADFVNSTQRK